MIRTLRSCCVCRFVFMANDMEAMCAKCEAAYRVPWWRKVLRLLRK